MATREETLRRILEAAGTASRLSDDERRELLGHLEDSADAKMRSGMDETEAIAQAFEEFGSVEKIVRQYPRRFAGLVTPEGLRFFPSNPGWALAAYTLLVVFALVQIFITPKFCGVYRDMRIPLPTLTTLILNSSAILSTSAPLLVPCLVIVGFCLPRLAHWRVTSRVSLALIFILALGLIAVIVGLCIPFAGLMRMVGD